jgi:thymidylate synthase|tara:strand:+ start:11833 stop:12699 length:867 start_codon:yes stop_codon:yes gene_type:complete
MKQYIKALEHILDNGKQREDRTGVGTKGVFGYQMRFDLRNSFPAVTTKKLAWKSVVSELLWFLEGSTDERRLAEIHFGKSRKDIIDKKTIWTANANKQGVELGYANNETQKELGPVYGKQWRSWGLDVGGEDQIKKIILNLKNNPHSRRHIVSAWNVDKIDKMALPPCHTMFQFHVQSGELSCQLYQRSADMFLGVPFNIASYALLTNIIANILNLKPGEFVWTGGDCHIYNNHFKQVKEQIKRNPKEPPTLEMPSFKNVDDVIIAKPKDFRLVNYKPMDSIKAPMAV